MAFSHSISRTALLLGTLVAAQIAPSPAAEPTSIVLLNGRSIPMSSVVLQGENFVVTAATEFFNEAQTIPCEQADHVFGVAPPALKQAVALLLMNQPKDAQKLLEPIVLQHRVTAKIPGNFWLDAARTLLVVHAVMGDAPKCTDLGKEISDATPVQGNDPFVALGKTLLMPPTVKPEDRDTALRVLISDPRMTTDVCAYASFYRGNLFKQQKSPEKALEAYLSVPCLFPTGGLVLMAAAELQAAEILTSLVRREEAVALLRSALRDAAGTPLVEEVNKRLKSSQ
jgi:hypothetical protein